MTASVQPKPSERTIGAQPLPAATLTIARLEGRGIWIELNGKLIGGQCVGVASRLERLAELAFGVVIIDTRRVSAIDRVGIVVLTDFVHRLFDGGGSIHAIDPNHIWQPIVDRHPPGLTTSPDPPSENWWAA